MRDVATSVIQRRAMNILFDHPNPFLLAHGGFQTQIEQTRNALLSIGFNVDWVRWWDAGQTADIIHYFGRPSPGYVELAQRKRMKVVMSELLTGLGSRRASMRSLQYLFMRVSRTALPRDFTARLSWDAYRLADACIALTPWEARLMTHFFDADEARVHVVPNGVEEEFFQARRRERGPWLVCTATITPRKRVVELAEAAIVAKTPLWIVGRPYSEQDEYYLRFLDLCRCAPALIRFAGEITDRTELAEVYRCAHGFVLLSGMESLSISALEAAACECPLLLSDLPWARSTFAQSAAFFPVSNSIAATAKALRNFYDAAPELPIPPRPKRWREVAAQLQTIYEL